jgi:hypothetical protein
VLLAACAGSTTSARLETCDAWEPAEDTAPGADPWDSYPRPPTSRRLPLYSTETGQLNIVDWPIVFDEERMRLTADYLRYHAVDQAFTGDLQADVTMVPRVVVLHWTGARTATSTWWAFNPVRHSNTADPERALNLSTQFLVDRDGTIYRLFPEDFVGRHTIGLNHLAIGVENVGDGRRWPLTDAQVQANIALVRYLAAKYPITHVIGHYEYRGMEGHPYFREIDPDFRTFKCDPGPDFLGKVREGLVDLNLQGVDSPRLEHDCGWSKRAPVRARRARRGR